MNAEQNYRTFNVEEETSKILDKKVKEPFTLLLFKGGIYEFTHSKDELYSQGQMALLYDLPEQATKKWQF